MSKNAAAVCLRDAGGEAVAPVKKAANPDVLARDFSDTGSEVLEPHPRSDPVALGAKPFPYFAGRQRYSALGARRCRAFVSRRADWRSASGEAPEHVTQPPDLYQCGAMHCRAVVLTLSDRVVTKGPP